MVKITCDTCQKLKPDSEKLPDKRTTDTWILGYDVQIENKSGVQRSIRFLDHWDDRRVLELGAIHLCSEACKGKYIHHSKAA